MSSTLRVTRAPELRPDLADAFAAIGRPRALAAGEALWFRGDLAEELALVVDGQLAVELDERAVSTIGAGELVGEASAFGVAARTATVRAQLDTRLLVISHTQLARLRDAAPAEYDRVLDRALMLVAERVRRADLRLARLAEGVEAPVARQTPAEAPAVLSNASAQLQHHAARAALRSLPALTAVADAHLDTLALSLNARLLQPGETWCVEGDRCRTAALVADGRLRVVRAIGPDAGLTVAELGAGRLVGVLALLLETPRSATLVAEEPTWLLEMGPADLRFLDGETGRIWRHVLLAALRDHLASVNDTLAQLEARRAARIEREYLVQDAQRAAALALGWPPGRPERVAEVRAKAQAIMQVIAQHRRLLPQSGPCAEAACPDCFALHIAKVERAVAIDQPIHFILPAYPAKSPNQQTKVLGALPDMAEAQSMRYLQAICDAIEAVYAPGARVTLCSDGRVFADLVLVDDAALDAYRDALVEMIADLGLTSIDTFNLEDLFEVTAYEGMRTHIDLHYGEPLEAVKARAKEEGPHRTMFNGIHRFLFEDASAVLTDMSRSKLRKDAGERAHHVIARSNAFSRLIAECFPDALRLSIHPQAPHSAKIGILLGAADGPWITPWHGVALLRDGAWFLTKRSRAEELGATLVEVNGRPSHFVLEA